MNNPTTEPFPWPMIPGLIGFALAFFIQFRLKYHIDREKVIKIENMAELYSNGIPPKKILTERGKKLYGWLLIGIGCFVAGILLTIILYARHE